MNDNNYIPKHASFKDMKKFYVKDNKKEKNRMLYMIISLIFIITFLLSGYKILLWHMDNKKTDKSVDRINDIVVVDQIEDNDNMSLISEEDDKNNPYWYYIKFPLINVNINKLKDINKDTVGWLNVNNTNINYPFVKTSNNDYYLNHSFDKSYNEAGWIFLDYRNDKSLSDRNNIIYAHSRLDKTMFGSLSKVLKSSWYSNKDNHIIRVSLENENSLWQIFSVYKIKEESYYITTYFKDDKSYISFLDKLKSRSLYDFKTNLNKDDKILTLSTCYSDTERTVVHARLIKKSSK